MANRNAPAGARVVGHIYGAAHSGTMRQYVMAAAEANDIFLGDFLTKDVGGEVDRFGNDLPYVKKAAVSDPLIGIFGGVLAEPTTLDIIYRKASVKSTVLVYDDPGIIFTIQAANLSTKTRVDILEQNADITLAVAGDTSFGTSGAQIDLSTVDTTAGLQLRIIEIANAEDNEFGDYVKLLCKINSHQRTWNQTAIS